MEEKKVIYTLISVAIGWLLAQGTDFAKDWWAARKLKAGLLIELEDIQDQLKRIILIHTRQLQIFALQGMEPTTALPLNNMFFKQYYKDVFSHLNRKQRISYQMIHATLENLNKKNEDLAKFFEESYKDLKMSPSNQKTLHLMELWGSQVIVIYKTAMDLRWHITYHLSNPKSPTLDEMGPIHKSFLKFSKEVDDEIKTIIEKAKHLKREDFDKIYDESAEEV